LYKEGVKSKEIIVKICDDVGTVKRFCYLGDQLSANDGCEAAVTARTRIRWIKFRECGKILFGKRYYLKMKDKIYRCCVRSAMLYGSETWYLTEKEIGILRRTERAMMRAMCRVKLIDKKEKSRVNGHVGNRKDHR